MDWPIKGKESRKNISNAFTVRGGENNFSKESVIGVHRV